MKKKSSKPKSERKKKPSQELLQSAMNAIEEAIYWYIVNVVTETKKDTGTVAAISWNGRRLFLTADHVIRDVSDSHLLFQFRPTGNLDRFDWWQSRNGGRLAPEPAAGVTISGRFADQKLDLAVLEVSRSLEKSKNLRFYELEPAHRLPRRIPSSVAVIGFPSDGVEKIASNAYALCASGFWTGRIRRGTQRPNDHNSQTHFLIEFSPAKDGRKPHGYSGAGVWFSDSTKKIWTPSPRLAGICTSYYPNRQLLSVCRIEKIIAFLEKTFGKSKTE